VGSSRIWCAPQKVSNDRRFDEKLIDVVGVYLNPPEKAVVLCPPSQQQRSQAVRMDRHGRGDPRESQPRPGRTRINPG
jgi:hypothetical protein